MPLSQDVDVVGQSDQLGQLAADDEHGDTGRGELADVPVDLRLGGDVDATGRLVEDQQPRLGGDGAGEERFLLIFRPRG